MISESKRKANREYYLKHREEIRRKNEEWKLKNPDYARKYYEENKEQHDKNCKRWREENRKKWIKISNDNRRKRVERLREEGCINAWSVVMGYKPKYKGGANGE